MSVATSGRIMDDLAERASETPEEREYRELLAAKETVTNEYRTILEAQAQLNKIDPHRQRRDLRRPLAARKDECQAQLEGIKERLGEAQRRRRQAWSAATALYAGKIIEYVARLYRQEDGKYHLALYQKQPREEGSGTKLQQLFYVEESMTLDECYEELADGFDELRLGVPADDVQ